MKKYIYVSVVIFLCGFVAQSVHAQQNMFVIEGKSMVPYDFVAGDKVRVVNEDVQLGDVIAFTCTHSECNDIYVKKVTHTDGQCYWLEGRRDLWKDQEGNTKQSHDSYTSYGWLCGESIDILGVVEHV